MGDRLWRADARFVSGAFVPGEAPFEPRGQSMSTRTAKKRMSWREKLDQSKGLPRVIPIGPTMSKRWGEGTVVIPAPREVDAIMRSVPVGKLITIQEIRAILAKRH